MPLDSAVISKWKKYQVYILDGILVAGPECPKRYPRWFPKDRLGVGCVDPGFGSGVPTNLPPSTHSTSPPYMFSISRSVSRALNAGVVGVAGEVSRLAGVVVQVEQLGHVAFGVVDQLVAGVPDHARGAVFLPVPAEDVLTLSHRPRATGPQRCQVWGHRRCRPASGTHRPALPAGRRGRCDRGRPCPRAA